MPDASYLNAAATSPSFQERLAHFITLADPTTVFASEKELGEAEKLVIDKKAYDRASDVKKKQSKRLYLSAYDPSTNRKLPTVGRMSFQPWGNTALCASMIVFSKTAPQIALMQIANQGFNAIVNAVNSTNKMEGKKLAQSFVLATATATTVGMALKAGLATSPLAPFVPFGAVAAGQAVNVPLMRSAELLEGIPVLQNKKKKKCCGGGGGGGDFVVVGKSRAAARKALVEVWMTRVLMSMPPLVSVPILTGQASKLPLFQKNTSLLIPLTSILVGLNLCASTPLALATFPQEGEISRAKLEPYLQDKVVVDKVRYNKGL